MSRHSGLTRRLQATARLRSCFIFDVLGAPCLSRIVGCHSMNPLFIILFRILQGDRLRKPTPEEEQRWAGVFFLVAVYFGLAALCIRYASHFWDTAGTFA